MTLTIIAFFSEKGVPKTGLSPTLDIFEDDGAQVATATAMTEIAGGFYKFAFTTNDDAKNYVMVADGTSTLANMDRYLASSNIHGDLRQSMKVIKNRLVIENNQMKIYDDDGTTVIFTFDLKDASGDPTNNEVFQRTVV